MVYGSASVVCPPERIVKISDAKNHLEGVIVLHSTRLGPAAGGCRLWNYPTEAAMLDDALRLAEGMSYKNALAGLPFGGGKAVLRMPRGEFDRGALFRAFGKVVEELGGEYVTAEDVGTTVPDMVDVAQSTRYVAGLPAVVGRPGGDPSPWTARGVFGAMDVACRQHLSRPMSEVRVGVQGLGSVGMDLCRHLNQAGATLVVADMDQSRVEAAIRSFGAHAVSTEAILSADVDILAPCALGAVIDHRVISRVRARLVCGAANNQLATAADGTRLAERGIIYAPDFLVNAGGIISVAGEYLGWTEPAVRRRVDAIASSTVDLLQRAKSIGAPPERVAESIARSLMANPTPTCELEQVV